MNRQQPGRQERHQRGEPAEEPVPGALAGADSGEARGVVAEQREDECKEARGENSPVVRADLGGIERAGLRGWRWRWRCRPLLRWRGRWRRDVRLRRWCGGLRSDRWL